MNRRQFLMTLPALLAAAGAKADRPCGLMLSPEFPTLRTTGWPHASAVKLTSADRPELDTAAETLGLGRDRRQRRWACFVLTPDEAEAAARLGARRLPTWGEWRRRTSRLWEVRP